MRRLIALLAGLAILMLAGCGSMNPLRSHVYSTPPSGSSTRDAPSRYTGSADAKTRPYTVLGRTYYPLQTAAGYDEVGMASWYGSDFHGKPTANGQTYDMYGVSAAHKTLPLGTRVRVTHLGSNRSVVLVVNDRGPFVSGRILDLSYGAARQLGMLDEGVAKVRISAIGATVAPDTMTASASRSVPRAEPSGKLYSVRVGAFSVRANAERTQRRLVSDGYTGATILIENRDGLTLHIVVAGSFPSRDKAERVQQRLKRAFPTCYIVS
ncbi:septal ring lytic transglycosylase RlpA family protein [Pseudodesulfovibrio sp.]|uniref:septal ring lytic transglycosylase RlpA family protein n=1 Tax=Pseudodesulfovibrio sp. TaxID=2035812 RepID=UPI00263A14D8|nr:septal ring lytic transglycosylase RlpA family protein [Pseudodesulfovibrio sp.]MDD3311854.1 septal ring lytic transglycosylase RlpA family protein [Pseudodesulfovibrio sp.]